MFQINVKFMELLEIHVELWYSGFVTRWHYVRTFSGNKFRMVQWELMDG